MERMTAQLTDVASKMLASASSGDTSDVWVKVAIALLGSSLIAGLITTVMSGLRSSATSRREGYASAVRSLIARAEYPYRVRRRLSDEPDVLTELVSRGHDLQEQLAGCRTWVTSESTAVGAIFEDTLAAIDATVYPNTADAWNQNPIISASGMNLGGWGPGDQWPYVRRLERAIAYRFGWRRLVPALLWRRWV